MLNKSNPLKKFGQNNEEKVNKLTLKRDNKNSQISSKTKSQSTSNYKISKNGNDVKISKTSVVIKTNPLKEGYNKRIKEASERNKSRAEVGSTASSSLSYIDRDKANEIEENEELSNVYTLDKQLTKDELQDIRDELKNGTESLRRDVISLNFDDKLSKDDHIEIVRNSVQKLNESIGQSGNEIYMAFHKNTGNNHVHLNSVSHTQDIELSPKQINLFKEVVAHETKQKLDEKELGHSLKQLLKKEDKTLDNKLELQKAFTEQTNKLKDLESQRSSKMEEAFSKYSNNNSFSQEEVKQLQQIQKVSGYVQQSERKYEKEPTEENLSKLEKAKSWEANLKDKMSIETQDKFEYLQKQIKEFSTSKEAQNINKNHLLKQQEILNKTANKANDLDFKKSADSLRNKADNLSSSKLKSFSMEKALQQKEKEAEMDKHLTHSQKIDKAMDGKLDNKTNMFQH